MHSTTTPSTTASPFGHHKKKTVLFARETIINRWCSALGVFSPFGWSCLQQASLIYSTMLEQISFSSSSWGALCAVSQGKMMLLGAGKVVFVLSWNHNIKTIQQSCIERVLESHLLRVVNGCACCGWVVKLRAERTIAHYRGCEGVCVCD